MDNTDDRWHPSRSKENARKMAELFGLEQFGHKSSSAVEHGLHVNEELNKATRFVNDPVQLNEMRQVLRAPGAVIKLPCSLTEKRKLFYNHPNYLKLHQIKLQLQAARNAQGQPLRLHVTGSPWMGTSYYLMAEMLYTIVDKHEVPEFKLVFAHGRAKEMEFSAYSPSTGWFDFPHYGDLGQELLRRRSSIDAFLLKVDAGVVNCNALLATPPEPIYYAEFCKYRCERRLLPPWTLDELLDAYSKLTKENATYFDTRQNKRPNTVAGIKTAFDFLGGNPIYVFDEYRIVSWQCPSLTAETSGALLAYSNPKSMAQHVRILCLDRLAMFDFDDFRSMVFHHSIDPATFKCNPDPCFEARSAVMKFMLDMSIAKRMSALRESVATNHPLSRSREVAFAALCLKTLCRDLHRWRKYEGDDAGDHDPHRYRLCLPEPGLGHVNAARHTMHLRSHSSTKTEKCLDQHFGRGKTRMLRIPQDGHGFVTESGRILLCGAVCREYIFLKSLRDDFAPGVDAVMYNPLVFFRFCASGVLESKSEDALLNMLLDLVRKFGIKDASGPWKKSTQTRVPFFLVVPDENMYDFELINEPILMSSMAKPGCSCTSSKRRPRKRSRTVDSSSACGMPPGDSSGADTRCWWCRCLQYFDIRVIGICAYYAHLSDNEFATRFNLDQTQWRLDVRGEIVPKY